MILSVRLIYFLVVLSVLTERVLSIDSFQPSAFDYHRRIGIPKAREIKKWESENAGKVDSSRIVGGWYIDISQLPYQGGLVIQMNWIFQSVCSTSLVSHNRCVTAAHCHHDGTNTANSFTVVLGSTTLFSGGLRLFTTDVVMHPSWNPNTLEADIAVIRIPSVSFSNVVQPIHLPSGNELQWTFTGVTATASGFGVTSDDGAILNSQRLSAVNMPVISHEECRNFYGIWMHNSNICTSGVGRRGICGGDSGGPLAVSIDGRNTLIGVSSYRSWHGCEAGDPSAFARVTSFVSWIQSI